MDFQSIASEQHKMMQFHETDYFLMISKYNTSS